MTTRPDVTAVLIGRNEGTLLGLSLRSVLDAAEAARKRRLDVEVLVLLADATPGTARALEGALTHGARVEHTSDVGRIVVRRRALELATGEYVAMIDDASLWSENWLVEAHAVCSKEPGRVIAHPEAYWFFDHGRELFFTADQEDAAFDLAFLRLANHWDALCLAPAAAYALAPLGGEGASEEFVDDNWSWSIATVSAGLVHRPVRDTLHFKRSRPASLFLDASSSSRLQPRHSRFLEI